MTTDQTRQRPRDASAQQADAATSVRREVAQLAGPIVVLAALLQEATGWGAGHRELVLALITVVVTQVFPGALIWRLVRPVDGWLVEDLVVGLGVGAAMSVPVQVLSVAAGATWLEVVLPMVVVVGLLALPATRRRIASRRLLALPWLWGLAATLSCITTAMGVLAMFRQPLRWQGWATLYVDMPFHQALAAEVQHHFPPQYPQVAGEPLTYHWFTHAWTAGIGSVSGTPLDVLLMRFNPTLLAVAVPLLIAVVAMRISGSVWAGPLAAAIAFLCLDVAPWAMTELSSPLHSPASPTQGFGLLVLVPALALVAMLWRRQTPWPSAFLLLLLVTVAGGSKGSTVPVLVAGLMLASVAVLVIRGSRRAAVWLTAALAVGVLLTLSMTLFGGDSGGVRLAAPTLFVRQRAVLIAGDEVLSGRDLVLSFILLMLPLTLGYIGGLAGLTDREFRRDPVAWMLLGCGVAGYSAILFLTHPGQSQWYFLRTADAPLSIVAAWGAVVVLRGSRRPGLVAAVGAAAGVLALVISHAAFEPPAGSVPGLGTALAATLTFLVILAAVLLGALAVTIRGGEVATRSLVLGLVVAATTGAGLVPAAEQVARFELPEPAVSDSRMPGAIEDGEVRAYRWLRDHSDPDDLVMTNRHCRSGAGDTCDHRRFVVAAYAERRVLVEGWAYTTRAAKEFEHADSSASLSQVEFWDPALLALNDGFIQAPTREAANRLWDLGVRWVVVNERAPHARTLAPFATRRLKVPQVTIYELEPDPGKESDH